MFQLTNTIFKVKTTVLKAKCKILYKSPFLPFWSVIIFCFLSFIPSLIILAFVIDNCIRKEVIQEGNDDIANTIN